MFDRQKYLSQLQPGRFTTNADWLTWQNKPEPAWYPAGAWHLSQDENGGNHHVYVDLIENGAPVGPTIRCLLCYTWEGKRTDEDAPPVHFDKQSPEPAANLPIWRNQIVTVWIEGDGLPSGILGNLRTDLPDEPPGNTMYHHSYYVVFGKSTDGVTVPPKTIVERLADLERRVADLEERS